jgi:hypothetical protein
MEKPNAISQTQSFEFEALHEACNYRTALASEFRPYLKGTVIEIGAGIGQFSEAIRSFEEVRRLVSVEPEARFCDKFRELHPDFDLVEGVIDDLPAGEEWNAILSINVLEHIREDQSELAKYHALLAGTRGYLCLFVPARPEIYAPIDRDFGHFRRYLKPDLRRMLRLAGFDIVTLDYYNSAGYLAWWVNFCLLRKRRFRAASVRLFDRAIFTFVHALESRVWRPPLGQSLIAVARATTPIP